MGVNPKEKAALQGMWGSAKQASTTELPDGTYQFQITGARFHMSNAGKPQFKTKLKVTGGAEDYIGKELEVNDNLETPENMGWFKRKLTRLGIAVPEDIDDIIDGTLAEQMTGKVFEGQAKTKNDFLNVYVNRLLGEKPVDNEDEKEEERQTGRAHAAEEPESESGFEEGQSVTWPGHSGEILEIQDDGKARVKDDDDGKTYRVDVSKLELKQEEEELETEEEQPEEAEGIALPSPEEAETLPATQVKKVLADLGIEAAKVKQPRAVLHGIVTLANDPGGKIELTQINPMAEALGVALKKGTPFKDAVKQLSKAVSELVGA